VAVARGKCGLGKVSRLHAELKMKRFGLSATFPHEIDAQAIPHEKRAESHTGDAKPESAGKSPIPEFVVFVCVFITVVPNTKLCAWGDFGEFKDEVDLNKYPLRCKNKTFRPFARRSRRTHRNHLGSSARHSTKA
jgi:hypothetical protein